MTKSKIAAGVDLGGTKILSIVATAEGRVLAEDRRPTLAADGPEAVIERIVASLRKAIDDAGVTTDAIAGAGISAPGPCDPARGVVVDAPNLPGWRNIELARIVSEQLGAPTVLEHDAAAACYGEYRYGAGRGHRHIVYATLGTGIGGGIIIDGRIYGGASGAAGEIGHIIVDPDGPDCNCGSRGCVEAFASGVAIARDTAVATAAGRSPLLAELAAGREPDAEMVLTAAQQGDETAREILQRAGRYLGLGLVGVLNSFSPQLLILGGGLVNLGDLYLEPAMQAIREGTLEQVQADVSITKAELGGRAGALGAVALVIDQPTS